MENKAVFLFEKENETEQGRTETIEGLETQRKLTSSSTSFKNLTPTCFFCDKDDSDMKLNMCQTFHVQWKIEQIAQEIGKFEKLNFWDCNNSTNFKHQ